MRFHKKRMITVSLVLLFCFTLLFGCSNSNNQTRQNQQQEQQQEQMQIQQGNGNPSEEGNLSGQNEDDTPNRSDSDKNGSSQSQKGNSNSQTQAQTQKNNTDNLQNNQGNHQTPSQEPTEPKGPVVLTITGDGVSNPLELSLEELQSLGGYVEAKYSMTNNWPTKKYFVGQGIDLNVLLEKAGIKSSAATITMKASDGYYATFTKNQLLGTRYFYPNWQNNSTSGAVKVAPMIAWAHKEGASDISKASSAPLRLLLGQQSVNEPNTIAAVQKVSAIEVSTASAGQWSLPEASPVQGSIPAGTNVELSHPSLDKVRIYYTLDGSEPTYQSLVYNPSTTYYQPDLIKPITIDKNTVIKAFVSGYGKADSQVATFTYQVE